MSAEELLPCAVRGCPRKGWRRFAVLCKPHLLGVLNDWEDARGRPCRRHPDW